MKTNLFFISLTFAMLIFSCKSNTGNKTGSDTTVTVSQADEAAAEATPVNKKYQIKSGIITFENDMMGLKQKSVLYFDDYGMKEAEEKYEGENVKEIGLCDGKEMYTIIPSDKTAYKSGSCYRGIAYKFDWNEIASEDQGTKAKKQANMNVAGKDCESYTYDLGSTSSVYAGWKNICLYQKTKSQMGDIVKKAVKVEENLTIPASKLEVPSDFEVKKGGLQL